MEKGEGDWGREEMRGEKNNALVSLRGDFEKVDEAISFRKA